MKKFALVLILITFSLIDSVAQNLSVGLYHSQYLCSDARAMSWGFDCDGRTGRFGPKYFPGYVNLTVGLKKVSAGGYHSLYLDTSGYVWSSGNNLYGQSGTGFSGSIPRKIEGLDSIVDISAGRIHSLFLRNDGRVFACGRNYSNQLGDGTNIDRFYPVLVQGIDSVVQISAGDSFSFFVRVDGTVYGCGSPNGGKLGIGPNIYYPVNTPIKIDSLSNIKFVSAGEYHSLFIDYEGHVFFCGDNWTGQAGNGSTQQTFFYPTQINTLDSVIQVDCEEDRSVFLRNNGTVWISGRHANGFVTGTDFNSLWTATQIPNLNGVTEIGIGSTFLVCEIGDSTLRSMGDNHDGVLGDATMQYSYFPVQVTNLCGAPLNLTSEISSTDNLNANIVVSPIPANENLKISLNEKFINEKFLILNSMGQRLFLGSIVETTFNIDISNFESGVYLLKIIDHDHEPVRFVID